jgi:hypothetical protein
MGEAEKWQKQAGKCIEFFDSLQLLQRLEQLGAAELLPFPEQARKDCPGAKSFPFAGKRKK